MSRHRKTTMCNVNIEIDFVVFDADDDFHPDELRKPLDAALNTLRNQLAAAINQQYGATADDPFVAVDWVRGAWFLGPDQ